MRKLSLAFLCVVAAGCNSNGGGGSVSSLTQVASDSMCPTGGVKISVGNDKNSNGKLDTDEVKDTQEVCNGAKGTDGTNGMNGMNGGNGSDGGNGQNGVGSLVNAVALSTGDAHCPSGGTELDFGLDNGANGGTAGDGVLQSGEVLSSSYVCNGSNAGQQYYPADLTPPPGAAGNHTIKAGANPGVNGPGGSGGYITLRLDPGSLGGAVKIFNTGAADAGFAPPTPPAFVAGGVPLNVTTDTTVPVLNDVAEGIEISEPYFLTVNDDRLFAYDADAGTAVEVTSISVAAGKTLTFDPGFLTSSIQFYVRNDIHNQGTITATKLPPGNVNGANFYVGCGNFYGDVGSSVITRGADATGGTAGNGGSFNVECTALVINQGTIDTRGGAGDSAGNGGTVNLDSDYGAVYNTGVLNTVGGAAAVNSGGSGGGANMYAALGTYNSGAIDGTGGLGVTAGGNGGGIDLETYATGSVKSSGALTTKGGDCTGATCPAGSGGSANITVHSGDLDHNATIDTSGGTGIGQGGTAGAISFQNYEGSSWSELPLATGNLRVSGDLTAMGGSGNPAGGGNTVSFNLSPAVHPLGQELILFGYASMDVSGSNGDNSYGGAAGSFEARTQPSAPYVGEGTFGGTLSGPLVNYADITVNGGDGTTGGYGGTITIDTQLAVNLNQPYEKVINYGKLTVNAGLSSVNNGQYGGNINLEGVAGTENHGALSANGSITSGGPSNAGNGGTIDLISDDGPVTNTGTCVANGGNTAGNGGNGGQIYLDGTAVSNSANLTANGGDSTLQGGNGGYVQLYSHPTGPSTNSGTYSVTGGTGTPNGIKGQVLVDGIDVTP
ncbi:MAG: hypothetical protein QM723_32740 [Myxococcaceae bacterium]